MTAHLGYWLRHVSNHVSQAFARKVEAHGVTVAEWVLMRHLLEDEALAPSRLAERMGMTRGAISKLADRLIAKSMLVRVADPEDGRAQTLSLASAGRALVPKLAALADLNDAEFFDHLAPDDRAVLLCTLREIVEKHGLKSMPVD
ncbi:MarR family transcriptional regulator [Allorhizobium ampelinum]|uniref:MarR family transcriptional regulator n=1 Tax=Agrobacterium vitis TaxID=373 RepID=A0ABD6HFC9_AGRVI|nr:MarR family transcriptional regulator [Allorhizobium ampelinum]MUO31728.1 MarR family transcriptional regulator [Agrobacterium vitis]MCF1450702.1 MarR family transcriptional regulator [Allorhizobium ampelinum]MCF1465116.1 MarR family transcriptional regulator [Allorhizobium ampelinum]MCF1496297.1 MarR family transcriptional regulator [Allorhizobium ampelinum]